LHGALAPVRPAETELERAVAARPIAFHSGPSLLIRLHLPVPICNTVPGNQKVPALLKEKAPVFLALALNMNKLYDPTPNPMFFLCD